MVRLFEACWHRKVPSPKLAPDGLLSPRDQLRALLRVEAATLKNHFVDILRDSDVLFVEMEEQRLQSRRICPEKGFFPRVGTAMNRTTGTDPLHRALGNGIYWYEIKD